VREGVDNDTLSKAVGHVPTTAWAGQSGNFAIAAHRDTLFRALKDVQKGDLVTFQTPDKIYTYRINSTRIVKPSEVSVLRPDGGLGGSAPHVQNVSNNSHTDGDPHKLLTMITCYPFYYVGSAPKRFIVQGELVSTSASQPMSKQEARAASPPGQAAKTGFRNKATRQTSTTEPRRSRGSSHIRSGQPSPRKPRKHGFWRKVLHM
jgi:sortase (surface protein transpeptidase)